MRHHAKLAGIALVGLSLLACRADAPENEATNEAEPPVRALPVAEPPLNREALLIAAMRAGSAFAAGQSDAEAQRRLDGKSFEFRIRFGCAGGEAAGGPFDARFDADGRRLTLTATADVASKDDDALMALAGEGVEAVEGFWIERPWLLSAACRAAPPAEETVERDSETTAAEPKPDRATFPDSARRVAIAQFFTANDPRTRRRDGRPYQFTTRLADEQPPSAAGYDLVVSGRLRRLDDGRVIACVGDTADRAPTCVISVVVDRVAMERADNGALLAEWGPA